jgi:molybdate transport system ATP-binding protein
VAYRQLSAAEENGVQTIASSCGIEDRLTRDFRTLSRGQATLVLLARALVKNPPLLLLDEAGHEPDAAVLANMRIMLRQAVAGGTALVYTSHHEDLLLEPDMCLILSGGRLRQTVQPSVRNTVDPVALVQQYYHPADNVPDETVRLENVTVWHGETAGLRLENFTAKRGEQWLVRGRNGAGKSTLLQLLFGMHRPAAGGRIIRFQGRYQSLVEEQKLMACAGAWMHGLWSGCTAARVIDEIAGGESSVAGALLRDLALDHFAPREFSSLSYGEQRMLVLAGALVRSPVLFLLDEPFNGLDAAAREYFPAGGG